MAQNGRARAYASAELRGLTTRWMAPQNVAVLPEGICRAKSWTFRRSQLEVVEGSVAGSAKRKPAAHLSIVDKLERIVRLDVDGDGDVGEAGVHTQSTKAKKKRQQQIATLELEQGVDLDGDGDIGVAGAALKEGTRVRDISGSAKFATPAIAAAAIGTVAPTPSQINVNIPIITR